MKPDGKWVAAPMNIHRINWIWGNKAAMESVGVTELPKTWADFNAACDKAVAGGKICLAHLSADWTDATTFEVVVYGQDPELFKKAFVDGDVDALRSDGMIKAFDQMRLMVSKYMDPAIAGRDYDTASNMMINGDALFFIMGDWELGTIKAVGHEPGGDILCGQAPTDWGKPGFILNSDSVVFFKQTNPDYIEGQKLLAHLILSPDFQKVFNIQKGSIPARLDIDLASNGFNACQIKSQEDLKASIDDGMLVRSMAHNMTVLQKYRGAMMDLITEFVNTPDMSSADAANAMADAVEAQM
jgi:glucose/mannose transport system substrate-binding protein